MIYKKFDSTLITAIYLAEQAENEKAAEYSISIADELRRLHKLNGELLEALKVCQRALCQLSFKDVVRNQAAERAFKAIAKAEGETA